MKLPKTYEPSQYESDIYALWEKTESFKPTGKGKPYSIVMPPPNANANLHIGYELTAALEDIAARYHRLKGESTLLLPGADHAGFETQSVYEKHLAKEGKSRFDYSREELYRQIWDFVALNREDFERQLRAMGVSCDWSRYTFTLDEKIIKQAYATFEKMWNEGLIYRGERLVNFCTFHGTAFADIEVVFKEKAGHLWHIRYPLTDGEGEVVVATTRPETMLGDTAVAVNPKDDRYKHLVGKTVRLPLTHREIPIIADEFVEIAFGTGAVKLTPAHDQNDFEAGQRHDLPSIQIIDHEGKITTHAPEAYRGLEVDEARKKVVADLKEQGFLVKTENYTHSVGHCYKCGTVIQPLLRDQWFIDMQPLAKQATAVLEEGKITFYPEAKKEQLINYLEGLRDWNISRQIAWGIPIPAFQNVDEPDDWIFDERVEQEIIEVNGKTYHRDPDVFDTWFSSSSWPYATLNFPDGEDFKQFYPTGLMETGGEILYPWVSRMIMLGLYVTGEVPFREVYIHGYVMAEDGSKMSKSVGNVVDPMPVIEQYGSDALRMGIISGRAPAVNRGYDPRRVEDARNFCNKIWNIARFIEDKLGDREVDRKPQPQTIADHWVLSKLQQSSEAISESLEEYRFAEAYDTLYHFVWDDFADWYIEASKTEPNLSVLTYCLESILTIAHPFAPFLTETIWQTLAWEDGTYLIRGTWPTVPDADGAKSKEFEDIKTIVTEVRYLVKTLGAKRPNLYYSEDYSLLINNADLVASLGKLEGVKNVSSGDGVRLTQTKYNCWLDIDTATTKKYVDELAAKRKSLTQQITQLENRLSNKSYADNAPKHIVDQTRAQLEETHLQFQQVTEEYERFKEK